MKPHRAFTALLVALFAFAAACGSPTSVGPAPRAAATLATAADRRVERDGIVQRFRELGAGSVVLLLHGYTDRLEMWSAAADVLARDHRVIVPDLRGFGASSKVRDPSDAEIPAMRADIVQLLDALEIHAAHVIGYSMGGLLAAHLSLEHPERVLSATFVACAFFPDEPAGRAAIDPYVAALERGEGPAPFLQWILPTWSPASVHQIAVELDAANDLGSLIAVLRALPAQPLDWTRVAGSRTPALAIVSLADPMLPHARLVASRWPSARLVELAEGDHADVFALPRVIAAAQRHITSVDQSRARSTVTRSS